MNIITITGNIGADAVTVQMQHGEVAVFSVAVTESAKNPDGTWGKKTQWYSCNYNNLNIVPFLKKGTSVLVQGRPYGILGKDGKPYINIHVSAIEIMGHPSNNAQ